MRCLCLWICLSFQIFAFGQAEKAIQYYKSKDYPNALAEWKRLMDSGIRGRDVYYNVGNTYYELKEYPLAILYYYKALKWDPNCNECKHNLGLAERAAGIERFELPEFILFKFYHNTILQFQALTWYIMACILLTLGIYMRFFKQSFSNSSKWIRLIVGLAVIMIGLAIHRNAIRNDSSGFVLLKASSLYLSPDTGSTSKQELTPGQFLEARDRIQGWIKVQTSAFDSGWIEASNGEFVRL